MILLIWKGEKYYYQKVSNNYLFCMLICTVIYKNIRTLNFNEIHFIRKFYWKFVHIYLKQRFYRRNISLSEINPKNSKIFSILDYIFFNYNYKILLPQYTRIYYKIIFTVEIKNHIGFILKEVRVGRVFTKI